MVSLDSLKRLSHYALTQEEKEHVTTGFYNNKNNFHIISFQSEDLKYSKQQQSIDTYEDFKKIKKIFSENKNIISLNWLEIYNNVKKYDNNE